MTEPPNDSAHLESLVRQYSEAALRHGQATEKGDYLTANAAHDELASVYRKIRELGANAQRSLLPLLSDADVGIRLWAASHALEFSPDDGVRVLSELERMPKSFVAFSAKMTLQQWRLGAL